MLLKNYFWYFPGAIPERLCNQVIATAMKEKGMRGLTGDTNPDTATEEELKSIKKKRDSKIAWMNYPWLYNLFIPYVTNANNNAGWNFQFDESESCQFTVYEPGQFYDWHADSKEEPYKNVKIRKLSVTVSLSAPKDYTGGELEFDFKNNDPLQPNNRHICREILPKGSIVVFPSFVWHRVRPVLRGTRLSLVIWNCGHPYR